MKKLIALILLLNCFSSSFSQSDVIKNGIALISAKDFTKAGLYFDSILNINPYEPDAIMMKGNLILNRYIMENEPQPVITYIDELIAVDQAPCFKNAPYFIPQKTADSVETFWRKCLTLDAARSDIHMGLCMLFGMSVQTEKLLKEIPLLKNSFGENKDEKAYTILDYARLLRERGKYEDSWKVFKLVTELYPNLSGIKSDWAGELLYSGDLKAAREKASEVLNGNYFDEQSRENIAEIFLFSNQILQLLITHKKYEAFDTNYLYYPLYDGVIQFVANGEIWKDFLKEKLKNPRLDADTSELVQFCRYITSEKYSGKYEDFLGVLAVSKTTIITWATINRASMAFPDSVNFKLLFGEFFLDGRNYDVANSYLQQTLLLKMDSLLRDDINFMLAYSFYRNNEFKRATDIFNKIIKQEHPFKRQAAMYFVARMKNDKAMLSELAALEPKSKYAHLAELLLKNMK